MITSNSTLYKLTLPSTFFSSFSFLINWHILLSSRQSKQNIPVLLIHPLVVALYCISPFGWLNRFSIFCFHCSNSRKFSHPYRLVLLRPIAVASYMAVVQSYILHVSSVTELFLFRLTHWWLFRAKRVTLTFSVAKLVQAVFCKYQVPYSSNFFKNFLPSAAQPIKTFPGPRVK